MKSEIIHSCLEEGNIKSIQEETVYSRERIYKWRKLYLAGDAALLMRKNEHLLREE